MSNFYARRGLRGFIAVSPFAALIAVFVFAESGGFGRGSTFASVFAVAAAEWGAALFAGLFLGFLFGLPKTLDRSAAITPSTTKARLATNTNLDQISDWLTKILVGLGLVELGKLAHGASSLSARLAPGLGGGPGAKPFAMALLVYSLLDGFLVGYVYTRVDLSRRFRHAAEDLDPFDAGVEQILKAPLPELPEPPPIA
jgi:hypothetical protein